MIEEASNREPGAVTSLEDWPPDAAASAGFSDRHDAGRRLAGLLERFRGELPIVIGIPRGGVPVAAEVARRLASPLDIAVVRKVGAPQNPEYAVGAVAEGGVHVVSQRAARSLGLCREDLQGLFALYDQQLEESLLRYRRDREPIDIAGRSVILVDDGLATGRSARAALRSLRRRRAARLILAVPVATTAAVHALGDEADEIVCVDMSPRLWAVGQWYEDFSPTADDEVASLLAENVREPVALNGALPPRAQQVAIPSGRDVSLPGELSMPQRPRGLVAFAHGSGSSRLSPRNRAVAESLQHAGYATLLFDLLTPSEERDRSNVFDIPLLASRLLAASAWLRERPDLAGLPLAYFGASTGAAAALDAAAAQGDQVRAVVSRGGRPDLARHLAAVRAPTLLIVGGADEQVLALNRQAQRQLRAPSELAVVPGATHLFAEPGALEEVGRLAIDWLDRHLG
jgi:putative phosphoribosyl transferase